MALYNVMEEIVRDVLMQYKDKMQLTCQCERCFTDIMAIALNELPPAILRMKNMDHTSGRHM